MSHPKFSRALDKDLVQRVGTRLSLQVTVEEQEEKVFFEWRGPSGSGENERVVITENGNTSICDITSLHLKDEGVWTCSAKNKHGVSQTNCNVLTQVPKSYKAPTFLEELAAVLTEQGTVSLECKVVGIPSPTLRWYRDGNEIRSGDVFALQANMSKPVSVYRCDAINCCGTVSSESILDISKSLTTKACSAPTLDEPLQDRKVKIGELVELSILVSRMSLPVRVVWWNHGSQIAVGDKYSLVENAEGRYSAIINPVELCDDGIWKVSVDNKFGSVSSECTLTLRVPKNYRKPRFMENLKAVLTKEGLVSFECKVVGYPTPLLRWFKDGAELKPGDVYQLSGSRSLGTYSCLARNCMGEAVSTASLTVEDIGEKFPDTKSDLRFLIPVKDASVKIGDTHRFSVQVTYSPSLELSWRHAEQLICNNEKFALSKEDGGYFHCDILRANEEDEGEWTCHAKDSSQTIESKCSLTITVPKHYKKPRFLEPLKAVLTEEGAVNLECKVIGVPQPALTWFKDGVELKAGDIHRLMSGKDGSCCLGTYTCVATNCMGNVTSSAALLGFEESAEPETPEPRPEFMTPDMSDGTIKPFSLSTIQEERTSQMMSPEAAETIRQHSLEQDEMLFRQQSLDQDDIGELSISIGNQEVSLSLYQTPDLSAKDAQNICEMFADEIMESISESNVIELPPLRFMKETAKAANISMEAVVIDIDEQDLEDYESLKNALENVDDLKTEADMDDVSICDWVEEPIKVMEYDVITCDAVEEVTTNVVTSSVLKESSDVVLKESDEVVLKESGEVVLKESGKVVKEEVQQLEKTEMKTKEKLNRTDSYNKDSESLPDMETCTADEDNKPILKDNNLDEDDLDLDIEFEIERRRRRSSSYDETLAKMDPELLKELGLLPPEQENKEQSESLDLSQLPTETAEDRISRIEAKAQKIIAEDDSANRQRSRSRSRSKSRPPNLDTVPELKTDEIREAKYYEEKINGGLLAQPSLDTIKESPSNASVAGLLAGGFSSASINLDLQQGPGSPCIAKKETGAKQIEKKIEREENKIDEEDVLPGDQETQKDSVDSSSTETTEITGISEERTQTEMHAREENLMDERCAEQEISEKESKKQKTLADKKQTDEGEKEESISVIESQDDAFIEAFKAKLTEESSKALFEKGSKENEDRENIAEIDRTSIDTADAIDELDKSLSISQNKQLLDKSKESKIVNNRSVIVEEVATQMKTENEEFSTKISKKDEETRTIENEAIKKKAEEKDFMTVVEKSTKKEPEEQSQSKTEKLSQKEEHIKVKEEILTDRAKDEASLEKAERELTETISKAEKALTETISKVETKSAGEIKDEKMSEVDIIKRTETIEKKAKEEASIIKAEGDSMKIKSETDEASKILVEASLKKVKDDATILGVQEDVVIKKGKEGEASLKTGEASKDNLDEASKKKSKEENIKVEDEVAKVKYHDLSEMGQVDDDAVQKNSAKDNVVVKGKDKELKKEDEVVEEVKKPKIEDGTEQEKVEKDTQKKKTDEVSSMKKIEKDAAMKKTEDIASNKKSEETALKKSENDAIIKSAGEEVEEEAAAQKVEQVEVEIKEKESSKKKEHSEVSKIETEKDTEKKKIEKDAVMKKIEEDTASKKVEDDAAMEKTKEVTATKKVEEDVSNEKDEVAAKKKAEEDVATNKSEEVTFKKNSEEDASMNKAKEGADKKKAEKDAIKKKVGEDAAKKKEEVAPMKTEEEVTAQKKDNADNKKVDEVAAKKTAEKDADKTKEDEDAIKKKTEEDASKKKEEEVAAKNEAEEDASNKKIEELAANKKAEGDASNKKVEEKDTKKKAQEVATKKKNEEDVTKKNAEKDASKENAEEVAAKKKDQEDADEKNAEKDAAKTKAEEDAAKKITFELEIKKKAEEDAGKKNEEEMATKKKVEEDAAKKKAEEDAAKEAESKKNAEEMASKKKAEEDVVKIKADGDAAKKGAEEDGAKDEESKKKAEEMASKKKAEEDAAKKKSEEDAAKKKAEEAATKEAESKKKAEDMASKIKAEEDAAMIKAEEDAAKKKSEEDAAKEAESKKKAEEMASKMKAEEDAAMKKAEEDAAKEAESKKRAEEMASKKKAEEDAAQIKAEEDAAKDVESKKKAEEMASKKKALKDAAKKKAEEDAAKEAESKKKAEEMASKKKAEEDAAKIKAEEDAAKEVESKKKAEEMASKKKAEEDAAKKKAEEDVAKEAESKKKAEEMASKKKAEEDAAKIKAEEDAAKEVESKKKAEEMASKKKAEEDAAKIKAEEDAAKEAEAKKKALEIALKKKVEEDVAKIKAEEDAAKKKAEEEATKRMAEEDAAKKKAEDLVTKKKAEEDAAKKKAEAEAAKKKAEEDAAKKKSEEDAAKKKSEEDAAKKKAEASKKKAEEDLAKNKVEAEAAKKKSEEDAAKKKAEADAAMKKAEEDAAKKKTEEDAAKKKAEADATKKKAEEDAAKKKAEAEATKKKADEDAAMKKAEASKKKAEEDASKKKVEAEAAKKKAEEDAAKKKAEEDASKKKSEEMAAKKKAEDDANKKKSEELAAKKKAEEDATKKKIEELAAKKKSEEDAAKKKLEEDAAKKKMEEAAAKEKAEEAEAKKKSEEDAARKKAEELAVKKKAEDQMAKKSAEEEAAKKKTEESSKKKLDEGSAKIKSNGDENKKSKKEGKKKVGTKKILENDTPLTDNSESPKSKKKIETKTLNTSDTMSNEDISVSKPIGNKISSQNVIDDIACHQEKSKPVSSQMQNNSMELSSDRQRGYHTQENSTSYSTDRQRETQKTRDSLQIQEKTTSAYSHKARDGLQIQDSSSVYSQKPRESTYSHNELNYTSTSQQGGYKSEYLTSDTYKGATSPGTERRFGANYSVDSESRLKQHGKEDHFKETVGKSLQTSHNLMSIAQEVGYTKLDQQPRTKPPADPRSKKELVTQKKKDQQETMKSTLKSKLALEEASGPSVPGGVSEIMIKEVGTNWASLCWKKPSVTRGSPVITYKVESWLCGEGAFWVEIGRTPIPQFDAFNLKANKCYHFRVTARNRRGWGDSIMTSHKVDLNKPTQMPKIQTDLETLVKCLHKSPVKLSIQVTGEPAPEVVWQRGSANIKNEDGVKSYSDISGHHLEIDCVDSNTTGKYNVIASNMAGKASKSVTIQAVHNTDVFNAYQQFKRWQSLAHGPMAPFLVNGPRDRRVQGGQSIQLTCRVAGNPWPITRWFKDTQEIVPDEYTSVYNEGDFQHVNFDDVLTEHSGRYCVEAFNEHGIVKEYFTLIVDNGLDRYMPPFFTKELTDTIVHKGCNLLLHCRVESYPYIGVTWHASGAKIRLRDCDYKLIDDDGNVVLVLSNVEHDAAYTCTIINEVAENTTTCLISVTDDKNNLHATQDEDVIRHSMTPMFTSWPDNQVVEEGGNVHLECCVERCTSLFLSREFLPASIDVNVIKFSKGSGSTFTTDLQNVGPDQSGLYFITARNSTSEVKYPVVIKVKTKHNLTDIDDCAIEQSNGPPKIGKTGPVFARDGDDATIKLSSHGGAAPFTISWTFNGEPVVWTDRVSPYNREGCVGIKILQVGIDHEGVYCCSISNSQGSTNGQITFVVDYAEHKESELMVELCNCPMLDSLTPLMSWSNTPIGTPRRTPLPHPYQTPLCTPRATPRSTPRTTPRATPQRMFTPREFRDSYRSFTSSSPGRMIEDVKAPPQRKRFVQAPEIFSSFSSKTVEEGQAVELKCFISCAPLTTTTWEKDNHPILSGSHTSLTEKTGVRALTVAGVTLSDAGVYKMTITNASGVANCSATLNVKPAKLKSSIPGMNSPYVRRSTYSPYSSSYSGYSSGYSAYSGSLSRNMRSSSRYL